MPANLVKSQKDEGIWSRAKRLASKYRGKSKWKVTTHIFENIKKKRGGGS